MPLSSETSAGDTNPMTPKGTTAKDYNERCRTGCWEEQHSQTGNESEVRYNI